MLCREQEEDCEHLFFKCPIDIRIWASQGLSDITSSSVFWATIPRWGEVRKQIGEKDLRWYGPYSYTVTMWFLRGKRYRVKDSSRRWRSLLVSSLKMCELEVMEGTIGHFLGLVTLYFRCMAIHHYG